MSVDERTFVADVTAWVTAILDRRPDLPYGRASVEERVVGNLKRHDFLLYRRGTTRVVLTGEIKMPDSPRGKSPFDGELVEDAYEKASRRGIPYYFTWNVRDFVLFETHRDNVPFMDRRVEGPKHVVDATFSDDVRKPEVQAAIRAFWEKFLEDFAALEAGRRPMLDLPLDRRFILRLEAALEEPISTTQDELARLCRRDSAFRNNLNNWMLYEQGWDVAQDEEGLARNLERAARLSCYGLVTRLVFYEVLRRRFRVLAPLAGMQPQTPQDLSQTLSARFAEAITYSRDYETIFRQSELGSDLPFLHPEAHRTWGSLIANIEDFDFSRLDIDVIGRLYEQLINPAERRLYGQFYTSPDVVDLINSFCIRSQDASVLDPACGGGTFLVRGYARKRVLAARANADTNHQKLLSELFGVDIGLLPAQLATINLAVRHVGAESNYPQIARSNFFDAERGYPLLHLPLTGSAMRDVVLVNLDAVVGNPPYIRQEDIGRELKKRLTNQFAKEWPKQMPLSGRSDIYAYFFTHAAAMLKPGGYLGFVTSIGWLDTDYGFRLQEFLLRNFRIIAVIESQVEKWFEDARVTTAVTIVQREDDEACRRDNIVRFIQLRKPLAEIYSEALKVPLSEENESQRQADMDAVRDLIEEITSSQTTDYWRVRARRQTDLWQAGCLTSSGNEDEGDTERRQPTEYKGGKWGQYIRGPDVWFDLLESAGQRMVPLHEIADVKRGFTSGIDKFFCVRDVTDEQIRQLPNPPDFRAKWGIDPEETKRLRIIRNGDGGLHLVEKRFLEPEFHSLMEAKSIVIRTADVSRLVVNASVSRASLRGTRLGDYVRHAEAQDWNAGATIVSRANSRPWYDLRLVAKEERGQMFWPKAQQYRHIAPWNENRLPGNDNLYDVWASNTVDARLLWAILNSTVVALSKHQFGRAAGIEGNLKTEVVDVNMMLVPDARQAEPEVAKCAIAAAEQMGKRLSCRTLPEEFSLPDRLALDDAVLEMLGFSDVDERATLRSRIYSALSELYGVTRERELVAQKDRLRSKRKGEITPADLAEELWAEHSALFGPLEFPRDFVRGSVAGNTIDLPPGPVEVGTAMFDTGKRLRSGTIRVGGLTGVVLDVGTVVRARFATALADCGYYGNVVLPDDADSEAALQEFDRYRSELGQRFDALAKERTRDEKKQKAIADVLMRKALAWRRSG